MDTRPLYTHACSPPHRTAAYPHSRIVDGLRSDHSKAMAKNVLSLGAQSSRMSFGSPLLVRALCAESRTPGRVAYIFL